MHRRACAACVDTWRYGAADHEIRCRPLALFRRGGASNTPVLSSPSLPFTFGSLSFQQTFRSFSSVPTLVIGRNAAATQCNPQHNTATLDAEDGSPTTSQRNRRPTTTDNRQPTTDDRRSTIDDRRSTIDVRRPTVWWIVVKVKEERRRSGRK